MTFVINFSHSLTLTCSHLHRRGGTFVHSEVARRTVNTTHAAHVLSGKCSFFSRSGNFRDGEEERVEIYRLTFALRAVVIRINVVRT